jgi:hypothetical protein
MGNRNDVENESCLASEKSPQDPSVSHAGVRHEETTGAHASGDDSIHGVLSHESNGVVEGCHPDGRKREKIISAFGING